MIDLGISKLALIGVVALIVIGPEKLPRVARMAGTLLGRAQRYLNDVKAEVSREIELDSLRQMHQDVPQAAPEGEQSMSASWRSVETELHTIAADVHGGVDTQPFHSARAVALAEDKARLFRRRKLAKTKALPAWYKHRHGQRAHVVSGSARMARHRAQARTPSSFF